MGFVTREDAEMCSPRVPARAYSHGRKGEGAQSRKWSLNVKRKGYTKDEGRQRRPTG